MCIRDRVQGFLYPLGFVVLQIQNDLGLGVVDDALTKSAAVKVKEIGKDVYKRQAQKMRFLRQSMAASILKRRHTNPIRLPGGHGAPAERISQQSLMKFAATRSAKNSVL